MPVEKIRPPAVAINPPKLDVPIFIFLIYPLGILQLIFPLKISRDIISPQGGLVAGKLSS